MVRVVDLGEEFLYIGPRGLDDVAVVDLRRKFGKNLVGRIVAVAYEYRFLILFRFRLALRIILRVLFRRIGFCTENQYGKQKN